MIYLINQGKNDLKKEELYRLNKLKTAKMQLLKKSGHGKLPLTKERKSESGERYNSLSALALPLFYKNVSFKLPA